MKKRNKKVIGILGGMGPDATITLFQRIVAKTPAERDQEHFPVLVDSNPAIPDRTEALIRGGSSPVPFLRAALRRLEEAGAEVIGIPCNTAHAFFSDIEVNRGNLLINMVELALEKAREIEQKKGGRVLLLATRGAIEAGIYPGLEKPSAAQQKILDEIIMAVKAGKEWRKEQQKLLGFIREQEENFSGVILGCTELSFLYKPPYLEGIKGWRNQLIDPLDLLAEQLIKEADPIH